MSAVDKYTDIQECWACGNEFDCRGLTRFRCDDCRKKEHEMQARQAVGSRGSVCYQQVHGHWSPGFVGGRAVADLGGGYLKVVCDDDTHKKVHIGSFSVYLEQRRQISLFEEMA